MTVLKINEGQEDGIQTTTHFELNNEIVVQRTYDAEPHLEYAKAARIASEGKRWGEGRLVGHIPPAELGQFLVIKDKKEQQKKLREWFAKNPAFVMYEPYIKGR